MMTSQWRETMSVWKARIYGQVCFNGVAREPEHIQVRNIDATTRDEAMQAALDEAKRYNFVNCSIERVDPQGKPKKAKLGAGFEARKTHKSRKDDARPAERAAYGRPESA
jgi:hypothetical protein